MLNPYIALQHAQGMLLCPSQTFTPSKTESRPKREELLRKCPRTHALPSTGCRTQINDLGGTKFELISSASRNRKKYTSRTTQFKITKKKTHTVNSRPICKIQSTVRKRRGRGETTRKRIELAVI